MPFIENILTILESDEHWQLSQLPENIRAESLYSATGVQVAVWNIKWEQEITLGATSSGNLADFLNLGVTLDKTEEEKKD